MIALITTIHVIACIVLILVILLQAGKGGGMGAAFGGAGAQTVFGGRGAQTFLGKVTSVCAGIFMVTSVALAYMSSRRGSVVRPDATEAPLPPPGSQPPQSESVPAPPGAAQENVQVPPPAGPSSPAQQSTPAAPAPPGEKKK